MNARRFTILLTLLTAGLLIPSAHAQDAAPPQSLAQQVAPPPPAARETSPQQSGQTFEPNAIRAWSIITDAAGPGRPAHDRIEAMAALGTMGNDERAARLIEEGFTAKDYDVRVAAVLAAGLTKNQRLIPRCSACSMTTTRRSPTLLRSRFGRCMTTPARIC